VTKKSNLNLWGEDMPKKGWRLPNPAELAAKKSNKKRLQAQSSPGFYRHFFKAATLNTMGPGCQSKKLKCSNKILKSLKNRRTSII
jgi:hypothetical protein